MGNSTSNDKSIIESLPSYEVIHERISTIIKENIDHNQNNQTIIISLGYPSRNIGFTKHDEERVKLDKQVREYLDNNYSVDYKLTEDSKYHRMIHIKRIACYCNDCVNKYSIPFISSI